MDGKHLSLSFSSHPSRRFWYRGVQYLDETLGMGEGTHLSSAINSSQVETNISDCEATSKTHWSKAKDLMLLFHSWGWSTHCFTPLSILSQPARVSAGCSLSVVLKRETLLSSMPLSSCSHSDSSDPVVKHVAVCTWRLNVPPVTACDRILYIISNRGWMSYTFINLVFHGIHFQPEILAQILAQAVLNILII